MSYVQNVRRVLEVKIYKNTKNQNPIIYKDTQQLRSWGNTLRTLWGNLSLQNRTLGQQIFSKQNNDVHTNTLRCN